MSSYIKTLKSVIAALVLSAVAPAAIAADTDSIVPTGFNALDYVLQRPAASRSFESKKFGDHMFLSVEGGATYLRSKTNSYRQSEIGYRAGVALGDWISPVYGWRVGASVGRHYSDYYNPFYAAASADFLLNFTGLLRGNTDRSRLEFIGAAGLELQALHRPGHTWLGFGGRIGLQMRVNVTPSTFFFIEPRLGIYSDNLDDNKTWHSYDMEGQIMAGFGYRMDQLRKWGKGVDNSDFLNERFSDNVFMGVTAGTAVFSNNPSSYSKSKLHRAFGGGFVGRWFAPHSAIRLQGQGGVMKFGSLRRRTLVADIDYMLNINTLLNGYDPDRKIELNVVAGASLAYANYQHQKLFPGLHGGVQGVWNITPQVGLFIEPQLRMFEKDIMGYDSQANHPLLMSQLNAGIILRNRPKRERDLGETLRIEYEQFENDHQFFVSAATGFMGRQRAFDNNWMVSLAFGGWYTPQSGFRVYGNASNNTRKFDPFKSVSVGADYMTDVLALLNGYDSERRFRVRGFLGLNAEFARYIKCYHPHNNNSKSHLHKHFGWGPSAALQLAYKFSDSFEFFVEPSAQVLSIANYRRKLTPQWRLQAGVTYLMGNNKRAEEDYTERPYTIGIAAGSGCISQGSLKNAPLSITADLGTWLNDVSGAQVSYHYLSTKPSKKTITVNTIGLDYMLNITALFNGGIRSSNFNLVGLVGPTIGWSNAEKAKVDIGLKTGLQGRWRLTDMLELTLTPNVITWDNDVYGRSCTHRYFVAAQIDAGLAVTF